MILSPSSLPFMEGNSGSFPALTTMTFSVMVDFTTMATALGLIFAQRERSGPISVPFVAREWQVPQAMGLAVSKNRTWPRAAWTGMSWAAAVNGKLAGRARNTE